MLKKLLLAAALAVPSLAFAGNLDIVVRVGGVAAAPYQYRPVNYRYDNGDQYQRVRWLNAEQEAQRDRIAQGVRSGELTRAEAQRLQNEQAQIREMEQRYRANGNLSAAEFARLQEELRKTSAHIQAQKHDRQDRDRYSYNRH